MRMQPASSPPTDLRCDVHPERERVVVALGGELDIATAAPVEREVRDLCERGFLDVCLDLRDLTFCDSSGLRLLLRLDAWLREACCRFSLVVGDGAASRVLRLARLDEHFEHAAQRHVGG